jgi:hypothetical protein
MRLPCAAVHHLNHPFPLYVSHLPSCSASAVPAHHPRLSGVGAARPGRAVRGGRVMSPQGGTAVRQGLRGPHLGAEQIACECTCSYTTLMYATA